MSRLKAGESMSDLKAIIEMKCRDWKKNPEMRKNLNPETLFRPKNFEKYIGQLKPQEPVTKEKGWSYE